MRISFGRIGRLGLVTTVAFVHFSPLAHSLQDAVMALCIGVLIWQLK